MTYTGVHPLIVSSSHSHSEALANYAVRNTLRDLLDWVDTNAFAPCDTGRCIMADELHAYLLTLMVRAGGGDGQG